MRESEIYIFAPFSEAQMEVLREFQRLDIIRPMRCHRCTPSKILQVSKDGLHCPSCNFIRNKVLKAIFDLFHCMYPEHDLTQDEDFCKEMGWTDLIR